MQLRVITYNIMKLRIITYNIKQLRVITYNIIQLRVITYNIMQLRVITILTYINTYTHTDMSHKDYKHIFHENKHVHTRSPIPGTRDLCVLKPQ